MGIRLFRYLEGRERRKFASCLVLPSLGYGAEVRVRSKTIAGSYYAVSVFWKFARKIVFWNVIWFLILMKIIWKNENRFFRTNLIIIIINSRKKGKEIWVLFCSSVARLYAEVRVKIKIIAGSYCDVTSFESLQEKTFFGMQYGSLY